MFRFARQHVRDRRKTFYRRLRKSVFGPLYSAEKTEGDPFFYKSDDPKTAVFDSALYCGAASGSYSLNSFPEGVSKDWHLTAEILDPAGDEMRIRITRK